MAESRQPWVWRRPTPPNLTPARYPWVTHRPVDDAEEQQSPALTRPADLAPSVRSGAGLVVSNVKSLLVDRDGRAVEVVDPRGIEWKLAPAGAGATISDEGNGIVTCLASVTGLVDRVDDNIHAGAYAATLVARSPKVIRAHDWREPTGKTLEAAELRPGARELPDTLPDGSPWPAAAGGLAAQIQFNLKTSRGRDAYEDVLFYGTDQEWSIGYSVPEGGATRGPDGVRQIKRLDLYEISTVLWGAMPFARTMWGEAPA